MKYAIFNLIFSLIYLFLALSDENSLSLMFVSGFGFGTTFVMFINRDDN